jgi:hypothetical protein
MADEIRTPRPTSRPHLLLFFGGLALAAGGCQHFTTSYLRNDTGALLGASAFVVGSVAVLVGATAALLHVLRGLFNSPGDPPPSEPLA